MKIWGRKLNEKKEGSGVDCQFSKEKKSEKLFSVLYLATMSSIQCRYFTEAAVVCHLLTIFTNTSFVSLTVCTFGRLCPFQHSAVCRIPCVQLFHKHGEYTEYTKSTV